jgi:nucleotide-binding universal stress UspA family protein
MRIVCGTDFSPNSAHATEAAAALARRTGDVVELLCATGSALHLAAAPDTAHGIVGARTARAEQLAAEAARWRAAGVAVETALDEAAPAEALVRRAAEVGTRMAVIGAVGHGLLSRLLVGSVAERVAMASPVPVLVVREGEGWRAWGARERPLRIVVAFDQGASARGALAWSAWLASLGDVQLTVCWVVHPAFENERAGAAGPGTGLDLAPATHAALQEELRRETAGLVPGGTALHLEINLGRIDHAVAQYARTLDAHLLVVGSHQRQGWERLWEGSVSRGVLHHAPMSVAVVPCTQADE